MHNNIIEINNRIVQLQDRLMMIITTTLPLSSSSSTLLHPTTTTIDHHHHNLTYLKHLRIFNNNNGKHDLFLVKVRLFANPIISTLMTRTKRGI